MPSVMLCAQQMSPTLLCVTTHHQQLWARHCTSKGRINYITGVSGISAFLSLFTLMFSLEKEVTKKIRTSVWWKSHLALFRWAIWLLDIMPVLTGLVCYTLALLITAFFISCIQWLMIFVQEKLLLGLQNNFTVLCSSTLKTQCEPLYLKDTELEK